MNREINQLIEGDCVIVTPTQGLARHLFDLYAEQQMEQGLKTWLTPKIISWSGWCKSLWDGSLFLGNSHLVLLNQHQSLSLWHDLIQSSRYAKQLLQLQATARQAQAAYQLCKNWKLQNFSDDIYLNEDAFAFKTWMESYELSLKANSWLDEAGLANFLLKQSHLFSEKIKSVAFYGFDEFTPQQLELIESLRKQACDVRLLQNENNNKTYAVMGFQDGRKELKAAAEWMATCHKKNPKAKIGIVVPNLRSQRERLTHELEKILCVENLLQDKTDTQLPFTLSIGKSLNEYSLVLNAFQLLQINKYRIQSKFFSLLLRTQFIKGHNKEASQRCLLDARLKKSGESELSFKTIQQTHEQLGEENQCPELFSALSDFLEKREHFPRQQSLGFWSRDIHESLKCFGWPGERTLNSEEYQTLEAWQKALEKLAALDTVMGACSFQQALSQLRKITTDISFQPQTRNTPIQIMGVAGASGMQFDYIWFMGLHDQIWPEQAQVNPFIPIKLQKELGITGASPESRLQSAKSLTANIVGSAKHAVLSYPQKEGDRDLRASPVLSQYQSGSVPKFQSIDDYYQTVFQQRKIEYYLDEQAPEIKKGESVGGGASLFRDQAACPFRAFARHRLLAEGLNNTEIGLAAADRGMLVHRTLQLFWQKMKHSEQLRRASASVLNKQIEDAVNKAIEEQARRLPETFSKRFREIERQRLIRLIGNWLQLESERQAFTVVATEKGHHVLFNDITLHMRIDRIDELSDGRLVIVDYKTGQASISAWEGERPDDPQLPLYAVSSDGDIAALAFGKIKTGDLKFIGLAEADGLIPNVKSLEAVDWADKFDDWKKILNNLATEYRTGRATVEPMAYACRYCDLHALCRIHERVETVGDTLE